MAMTSDRLELAPTSVEFGLRLGLDGAGPIYADAGDPVDLTLCSEVAGYHLGAFLRWAYDGYCPPALEPGRGPALVDSHFWVPSHGGAR